MGGLSANQLTLLTDEGYLVVEDVLDRRRDIQPLLDEYAGVLDQVAETFCAEGLIASTYSDVPFCDRLVRVCSESGRSLSSYFDISLPQTGVQHDTPIHLGPAVFDLLTNARLLDVVESVIGPEIYANPVQHVRMKLPTSALTARSSDGLNAKIPWHQDNGVVLPEADAATILTVWLPLTDATVENGCLQVIPRSHRGDLVQHCPGPRGAEIAEQLIDQQAALPLPMRPGSLLLMHQRTIHSSLENTTRDHVRISFDLRYQPIGQPTGRPAFPGFVARSAAHPEAVLRDASVWAQLWLDARARLAEQANPAFNRWKAGVGVCA
jgi:phytanoyl-CoA hydroxylase